MKWFFQFASFTSLLFLLQACSNNTKPLTHNLQNDTFPPPKVIAIADLPDSLKAIITPLDKAPKATVIPVPKQAGGFYKHSTQNDSAIIQLEPPKVTELPVLKDDKGNILKDRDGHPVTQPIRSVSLFTNFTMADGLGLNTITGAILDHYGNLWFGHDGAGATRYDGKTFTTFTKEHGLSSNYVYGITEDKSGNLLFMTAGDRVSRFDGKRFTLFGRTVPGILNVVANFQSIIQDRSGNLWFASGTGVTRFDGKSNKFFTTADGLANNNVYAICEDTSGELWFGSIAGGLSSFDGKKFSKFSRGTQGLVDDHISCITLDKSGKLWFGTDNAGASCYDGKKFTTFTTAHGLVSNSITCITQDRSGKLWFGTDSAGASRYDGKSFTSFTRREGLSSNFIMSITEDNSGSIWFGTYGAGVCRYDGDAFTMFSTTQGLAYNSVQCVTEDVSGNMWFGTAAGGASFYDGIRFRTFTNQQGLGSNFIYAIANDRAGNLWFSTVFSGLTRYDGKTFTQYTTKQGLVDDVIWSVIVDNNQNIWAGTSNGISMFDGKAFTSFKHTGVVSGIFQDRSGIIWFGAYGSLVRYDGKSFTYFNEAQGLPDEDIRCIAQDTNGNIWLGTDAGVSRFDGKKFDNLTTASGLADNNVYDIIVDKEGNIYISTNIGITELAANVISLPVSKMQEGMRHFTVQKGYPISAVWRNSMYCDSKNIIWIGTATENAPLIRFDPSALPKQDKRPPSPVIQQIKVDDLNICWSDLRPENKDGRLKQYEDSLLMPANITEENLTFRRSLTQQEREHMRKQFGDISFDSITPFYLLPLNLQLPHTHNNITIDFNANEVAYPHLVNYQYILEGYNKDWSPATKSTTASFGNIHEGNYTFKVKAQGPNGIWSKTITYTFKVLPPWWRTWWAYALYALALVSAIWIFIKWRVKALRKEKILLEEKVIKRTEELKKEKEKVESTLTELKSMQAQLIQSEKMASLGELTAGIAHEIQNPLNFVNNFSEVNTELINELVDEVDKGNTDEVKLIAADIKENSEKINHHGKRADAIVKGMLQHSRVNTGQKEPTDINALCDEYLRLTYHGFRAKDPRDAAHKSFIADFKTDFDNTIGKINIVPQDFGRVLLNLINNAFYAVNEKTKQNLSGYEPLVIVSTAKRNGKIELSVKDNGNGIPDPIKEKIFQPFFTTKPTGSGTGLGLSLSYDIVKAHGGEIKVETKEGEGSEFIVSLPIV